MGLYTVPQCFSVSIDGQWPVEALVGEELYLTCRGDFGSTLRWHHNGMPLEDGARHSITKEVSDEDSSSQRLVLRVLSVTLMDVGVYSCRNTDDYFDQSSVTLFITESEPSKIRVVNHYNLYYVFNRRRHNHHHHHYGHHNHFHNHHHYHFDIITALFTI